MRRKQENNNLEMLGRPMTLGKKIKELRKLKGWRQQDVADKTGLKRPHISRIERDDYDNCNLYRFIIYGECGVLGSLLPEVP